MCRFGRRRRPLGAATVGTVLLLWGSAGATATEPAPKVWSGKATYIHGTTVLLSGWVDSRNLKTTCEFQVGTTTSYSVFSEPNEYYADGIGNSEIYEGIPGLKPHTTYHFRLVAHSRGGTTYGKDKTFRTGRKTT
jgi:hypothetical protein